MRIIEIIVFTSCILLLSCCNKLERKGCSINSDYLNYHYPEGYKKLDFKRIHNSLLFPVCGNCTQNFIHKGIAVPGCLIILNDTASYFKSICDTAYFNKYKNEMDPLDSLYFEKSTILIIISYTEPGLGLKNETFVAVNDKNKELLIRCQYEVSDQCAGSEIDNLILKEWLAIPKIPIDYSVMVSVENVNPLN